MLKKTNLNEKLPSNGWKGSSAALKQSKGTLILWSFPSRVAAA